MPAIHDARMRASGLVSTPDAGAVRLKLLSELERKVLWLTAWMIHHANHIRPNRDGLKVGGHQASSTSVVTLMTALYFDVLRASDRVAVKPHASPVYHAIQYLLGRQTRERLERFRGLGGAQSYPSRTKDIDDVDFSTGSMGLGVAMTSFASLVQDYVRLKGFSDDRATAGRMIAVVGDAEFDEGNVFEALFEAWKHNVRNVWWIVDYNRQSLDGVVTDGLLERLDGIFRTMEWRVVTLKYGKLLQQAFRVEGGEALRCWIDTCPNSLYSVLAYKGGAAWRERLVQDLGNTSGIKRLLDEHDDAALEKLMTNLAGHDLEVMLEAFQGISDDQPTCFLTYTIKGYGLPFAAHKDNHSGLMTPEQVKALKDTMRIMDGEEWEPFAGLEVPADELRTFLDSVPFNERSVRQHRVPALIVPPRFERIAAKRLSTQEGFGRLLGDIARRHSDLANRIVTTSPDVTVSTSLGTWVNRRGVFARRERNDAFRDANVVSPQHWEMSPRGQHIELGIAENNLFILLSALGLAAPLFGSRLLPIGTVYDAFICRGLDALNYACYQDARFILVATPSGLALAPEGGAHQSVYTPLIGLAQPGLIAFEPAYVDELSEIVRWSLEHIQDDNGGSVYIRLSTRPLDQLQRSMSAELSRHVIDGGYWLIPPDHGVELAIVCCGAVVPEAIKAHEAIREDIPGAGLLIVTSAAHLYRGWLDERRAGSLDDRHSCSHVHQLLSPLSNSGGLVTIVDGHPATLSWLGAVRGQRVFPLGVDRFGQSGDIADLYRTYRLDADAIVEMAARSCLEHVISKLTNHAD